MNSVKYAKNQGPRIEIEGKKMDNCCVLTISDNGLGILENETAKDI